VRHISTVFAGNSVLQQYDTEPSDPQEIPYHGTKKCLMKQIIISVMYPSQTLQHEINAKHDISSPKLSINVK